MTEITGKKDTKFETPNALETFVLQWGDFGGQWGVNRSVSQIHALLYVSDYPMTADQISNELKMARSNVSNSIRELLMWKLIHRVPMRGERKDHFAAETDVWEIATRIAAVRKAREIDPALSVLQTCVEEAEGDASVSENQREKLRNMLEFTQAVDRWYSQMLAVPQSKRTLILKLGSKILSYLPNSK